MDEIEWEAGTCGGANRGNSYEQSISEARYCANAFLAG